MTHGIAANINVLWAVGVFIMLNREHKIDLVYRILFAANVMQRVSHKEDRPLISGLRELFL